MKRRILPMIMVITIIMSIIQVPAWAADGDNPTGTDESIELTDAGGDDSGGTDDNEIESLAGGGASPFPAAESGVITLTEDITVTASQWPVTDTVTIDLNGRKITMSDGGTVTVPEGKTLTIQNGTIEANNYPNGTTSVFSAEKDASIVVDRITMTTNGAALFPAGSAAAVTVTSSNITAGTYVVGTNADTRDGTLIYSNNVQITLENSTFDTTGHQNNDKDTCTVMINVPGTLKIDRCQVTGHRQAVMVRGGEAQITNSTITLTDTYSGGDSDNYDNANWGAGNNVPMAALLVGNRSSEYKFPATCTLEGTTITAPTSHNSIYLYQMAESDSSINRQVTLNIESGTYGTVSFNSADGAKAEISISGGTFSSDVSDYLAEGVDLIANNDGTYTVGELTVSNAAAVVTNAGGTSTNYYGTLAEAINAAQTGDTVTALRNLTSNTTLNIATGITLDLDGNTLTITGPMDNNGITVSPTAGAAAPIAVTIQGGTITDARGKDRIATGRNTVCAIGAVDLTTRDLTVEAYAPADQASPYYNYLLRISPDQVGAGANAKVGTLTLASGTNLVELDNGEGETYGVVGISVIGPYSNANDMPDGYVGTTLVVEDGVSVETTGFAICGNGASHGTTITIEGGSLISNGSTGIYHPQSGTMTIDGDTVITGENAGIEIRAGEVTVNGGTISGLATPTETTSNGNGTTSSGAGIAVAQHTTKLPITLTINGGTINGYSALYESNPENNGEDDLKKVELSVVDGTFNATNGGTQAVYSADKTGFITGGSFSTDPSAYVADTYIAVAENGMYGITEAAANAAQVVAAAPAVDAAAGISSEVTTALAGTEADGLTGEANSVANDNTVTEEAGKDALEAADVPVAENQDVAIVVQPYLDIQVTAYEKTEDTTPNTMTLDITPMVRTVATTADPADEDAEIILTPEEGETQNAVQIGEAQELEISTPITLTIPLPSGFAASGTTVYIQHKGYEYQATVAESNGVLSVTFTNPHGFSEFTLSTKTAAVARIGDTSYTSLQAAVDAVKNNGTITLVNDCDDTATVSRPVTFMLDTSSHNFTGSIVAGNGYTLTESGNKYVVTRTPVTPVDPGDDDDNDNNNSGSTSVRRYNIEADAGRGGDISPDGRVRVRRGENQTFRITADDGWEIADVEVDGESVGAVERYTFENVRTDHTISVTFRQIDAEPETPTLPFTDVAEGDWYHDAVAYCWENGIMDGTSGTTFAPNMLLNRAMMAQVLYNLADGTASTAAGFPDVAASAWYADAVNWAAANGYVTGYDNGSYGPEDSLTREQLAVILYRYAGSPAPAGTLDGFADAASASAYAVDALRWAVGEGLLTGKDGGRLDPTGTASRAELAQILARFAQM